MDVNSRYAYFLLCDHFSSTSIVCRDIENAEKIVGFIGGYRKPAEPDTLFVWQIAVAEHCRGHKLSHMMLERLLQVESPHPIQKIQATYTPSNKASCRFFSRFAREKNADVALESYLSEEDFEAHVSGHESEKLVSVLLPDPSVN